MPFKFHEPRRHRIPRARYRVTNWSEYDRGLVGRGDIRFWVSEEALTAWVAPRRHTRGGQARFSDLAIEAVLMLGSLFRLPLRQAEGFARSLFELMGLALPVPDHTTLARRRRTVPIAMNAPGRTAPIDLVLDSTGLTFHGPGDWDRLKHGEKRRAWRKLHVAVDAGTGEILAFELTDSDTADATMAGRLVAQAGGRVRSVIGDLAYDGAPVYAAIRAARPPRSPPRIIIPPVARSIPDADAPTVAASGNATPRPSQLMARWRGRRPTATAVVLWSRRRSPD